MMSRWPFTLVVALGLVSCLAGPAAAAGPRTPLAWAQPVEVASGHAFRGPWRMNESEFDFVDDPTVALLADGDIAVAWVDQARKDVLFRRYGPRGDERFSMPVNVSRSPRVFSWLPRVAAARADPDRLFVLWQEIVFSGGTHGGEIFFSRSTDGGRSFSEPINLSQTQAGAGKGRLTRNYWHNGSLDLAVGPDGTLYAAWTEYEGPLRLARSTDGGASFTVPRRVAGGPGQLPARGPSLAIAADGVVHLAWAVGGDVDADIRYARSADGAITFSRPRRVAPRAAHADAPKLALGGDGTLHLVYAESASGPLGRYAILYTRKAARADRFDPPRMISAPLPEGFVGAGFPHLAAAGGARLYVVCELFREGAGPHPRGLAWMVSLDRGGRFSAPAVVPGTAGPGGGFNGSQQGLLMRKLAAGPAGRVAVVNSTFERGEASQVRLFLAATAGAASREAGRLHDGPARNGQSLPGPGRARGPAPAPAPTSAATGAVAALPAQAGFRAVRR